MLSTEQIKHFDEQGFIVLDEIIPLNQIDGIKQQANLLVEQWVEDSPAHVFTTNDNNRSGDSYFLDSAEKIR
jgi:phytanoyl-CoA hydroxylase